MISCGCYNKTRLSKLTGIKNPNWNSSLSPEERESRKIHRYLGDKKLIKWAKAVKKRDKYLCKKCGKSGKLESHHINSYIDYPNERYILKNGVTLCITCHKKYHKKYGQKHANKKDYQDFIGTKNEHTS